MTEPDNLPEIAKRLAKAFANNHLEHVGGAEAETLVKGTPNWHFFTRDAESAVKVFEEAIKGPGFYGDAFKIVGS